MKFPYTITVGIFDTSGQMIERPMITVQLESKTGEIIEVLACIDSGADRTLVNMIYAEDLGMTFERMQQARGIGRGTADILVGHLPFTIKDTNIKLDIPASYIESENVGILLGQEGFFDHFKIIFDKANGFFKLIEAK